MISVDFGPEGRLYVAEKVGRILTFEPNGTGGFRDPEVLVDLSSEIDFEQESGLLGLVVDSDFVNSRAMYLLYTTVTEQRIVRITLNAEYDRMVPGSETLILGGLPRYYPFHKAGDLQIHPLEPDHLYVSLGDDGGLMIAQDPSYLEGKILRINKHDGTGLLDNPFQNGDLSANISRVWAVGFRNPFRFVIHPDAAENSAIYVSENGVNTDRYSWVGRGSNGNWGPNTEDFLTPTDPNFRILGTTSPFLCGIAIAGRGPFEDPDHPGESVLYISNPQEMDGRGTIRRYRLTGPNLDIPVAVARDGGKPFSVGVPGFDMAFGPDKVLYLTQTAGGESPELWYRLSRIRYITGEPPEARIVHTPAILAGETPFEVHFGDDSTDFDGFLERRLWTFGDGETSREAEISHLYQIPGSFTASLTVWDNSGLLDTATVAVQVTSTTQLHFSGEIFDGRDLSSTPFPSPVEIRFYEEDGTSPLVIHGETGTSSNAVMIAAGGAVDFTISAQLRSRGVVYSVGENVDGFSAAIMGLQIAQGANTHEESFEVYLAPALIRGQIRDTRGAPAALDVGVAKDTSEQKYAFAGGRDYLPTSSVTASGIPHRRTTDRLGYYNIPLAPADAASGTRFILDLAADTGTELYIPRALGFALDADAVEVRNLSVGLVNGGRRCDNLAAHAETAEMVLDFQTHIRPILENACIGCHEDTSDNSGGLNLHSGAYQRLLLASSQIPNRSLVEPGSAASSYLFEKINCADPQFGDRMRPTDRMPLAQQALIYYWIEQGAKELPDIVPESDAGLLDSDTADAAEAERLPEESSCDCRSASPKGEADETWLAIYFLAAITLGRGISIAARKKRG